MRKFSLILPRWKEMVTVNTGSCYTLSIQVCPKKGINPTILLWGWDWDHQTYSREGYGSLGILICIFTPKTHTMFNNHKKDLHEIWFVNLGSFMTGFKEKLPRKDKQIDVFPWIGDRSSRHAGRTSEDFCLGLLHHYEVHINVKVWKRS